MRHGARQQANGQTDKRTNGQTDKRTMKLVFERLQATDWLSEQREYDSK